MKLTVRSLQFAHGAERRGNRDPTWVFRDFDLDVEARSMHAVVGPSGCGKSTLLRLIAGLERPLGGTIRFEGPSQATNRVALVFQDPTLLPWWTVGRNIGTGVEFDRRRRPLYDRIRNFNLDRVGLRGLGDRLPHTLSRGQQTRTAIGRAMAHDADLTLLDEPFVHLDTPTKHRLWQEFETHWQLEARTYLLVTHDIDEAVLLSDRVSVLSAGEPTSLIETIEVGLGRPRGPSTMTDPGFRSAVARVWEALEGR